MTPLWTAAELGEFLGLEARTVTVYASRHPARLPPRVQSLHALRWVPSVCQAWAERHSAPVQKKVGRPRINA